MSPWDFVLTDIISTPVEGVSETTAAEGDKIEQL